LVLVPTSASSKASVPELALRIIGLADLPVAVGVLEAFREARKLLGLADVQEEFQHDHAS